MPPTEGKRNDGAGCSQPEPSPSPQLLGKRSTRAAEKSEDDDEVNSYSKEKRTNARSQEDAAGGSASAAASQEDTAAAAASSDGAATSDVSSPIRVPYMVNEPWDAANVRAYQESAKYQAKLGMFAPSINSQFLI